LCTSGSLIFSILCGLCVVSCAGMHVVSCGGKVFSSTGRVWGMYPFVLGLVIPMRACSVIGLVLRAGAIVPVLISLKFRFLVWPAVWRSLCGLYPVGVGVVGMGLE